MSELNVSRIEKMIFIVRGMKVMLDSDLAELYGVETKALNRAVKRNISRFPDDFLFTPDSEELTLLRYQIGAANVDSKRRFSPYLFTENGVAMLSGILNSERAITVNISIMRTFTKIRSLIDSDKIIAKRITELQKETNELFEVVFDRLDEVDLKISQLKRELPVLSPRRKRIGLKK
jgi:hypothetical protein